MHLPECSSFTVFRVILLEHLMDTIVISFSVLEEANIIH